MYDNAHLAVIVFEELPGLVDGGHYAVFIGEGHVTHGGRDVTRDEYCSVLDVNALPTL